MQRLCFECQSWPTRSVSILRFFGADQPPPDYNKKETTNNKQDKKNEPTTTHRKHNRGIATFSLRKN